MRMFPIMLVNYRLAGKNRDCIPWELIEKHEKQAVINHGQSLERLAERGGLSYEEALLVLTDKPLSSKIVPEEEAIEKVRSIVELYNNQAV